MNKPLSEHPKLLLDPYLAWCDKEGAPITEDFGIDLLAIPTAPWPRFGVEGAIAHLKGRGDFVSIFVLDLAPGAQTSPQKHLYEEVVYVLSGYAGTTVETSDGRKHSFEWGPKSLFALPLNARYQHFNTSGRERARASPASTISACSSICFTTSNSSSTIHSSFPSGRVPRRISAAKANSCLSARPQHVGDNFSPRPFGLRAQDLGRARRRRLQHDVRAADGTMHAHTSQMPVGTYKKGHRHGPTSTSSRSPAMAFSLPLVTTFAKDLVRVDWKHGVVFAPPRTRCSTSTSTRRAIPARYLAVAFGGLRYPVHLNRSDTCSRAWTSTVERWRLPDRILRIQDPRIHRMYLEELGQARRHRRHGQVHRRERLQPKARLAGQAQCTTSNSTNAHVAPPARRSTRSPWTADNVELTTVGIDIGSSTSHLMFAHVHLQRLGTALSSRFVVVNRRIIWQSPILLTPYLPDYTIEPTSSRASSAAATQYAALEPATIDSGAVILTGEAIKRRNARAIADCSPRRPAASSAPRPATTWSASSRHHGSGAVALSRGHKPTLLNVDIGGGTTKLTLDRQGPHPRTPSRSRSADDSSSRIPSRGSSASSSRRRRRGSEPRHRVETRRAASSRRTARAWSRAWRA
jgi:hypothetical protein